jgi:Na+/melibiose symporter-like transporter
VGVFCPFSSVFGIDFFYVTVCSLFVEAIRKGGNQKTLRLAANSFYSVKFLSSPGSPTAAVPLRKGALSVLFLVVFLDNLGFAIVVPYLYFYVQSLGGTAMQYGILLASYSILSFLFTPVVARASDRYGRRRILLVALAVSSLAYFVFGAANVLWLLFVAGCFLEPRQQLCQSRRRTLPT